MNKKLVTYGIAAALGVSVFTAEAALTNSSVLSFSPGQVFCPLGGTAPNSCVYGVTNVRGSYFGMDMNSDGRITPNEKNAISANEGILIGQSQDASGSHMGAPDGSENPGIDNPWSFFGNTGMHKTVNPIVISAGDDGTGDGIASLDFSGWTVTWNGIPAINMGSGANSLANNPDGIAVLSCELDCSVGELFTLDYSATVPLGDPSNFGGVQYALHLEGVITTVPVPAAIWLFGSGLVGLLVTARRKRIPV